MNKFTSGWGSASDRAGGAYDAPPDPLVSWEGIGAYGASIAVPSALAWAPAAPRFCRTIFMSVAPPLQPQTILMRPIV